MKSKKGIDIVTSVGTRLYDAFVNASTSGMKRVVTTVGTGDGPNQMAMQNDTTIVDAISISGGSGLPTAKAVADAMCKTVWTGNSLLIAKLSNFLQRCLFCCLKNIISCFILQVVLRHQVAAARVVQ